MPRSDKQNEQMRAESREKIIVTARQLFAERGYNGCNVSDIAQQAGMSKGNIYWYFKSKEDILSAILTEGFRELGNMMSDAAAQTSTGREKLDQIITGYITMAGDHGGAEFIAIVTTLLGQGGVMRLGELGTNTAEIGAAYHQSVTAIMAQGQAEGTLMKDIDPNLLTTFFFSFFNGLMLMYPGEWKHIPTETIHEAVLRLLGST